MNAAGPSVSRVLSDVVGQSAPMRVRMVKGSHIVVPRLFRHDRCYLLQNPDGRICFAIPWQDDFTLIGTTDEDYAGDPAGVAISPAETDVFVPCRERVVSPDHQPEDVVWTYAGVRPLRDDGATAAQEATRDYVLELNGTPPVLSVFGGKITTFRRLAEAAMARAGAAVSGAEAALDCERPSRPAVISRGTGSRRCAMTWPGLSVSAAADRAPADTRVWHARCGTVRQCQIGGRAWTKFGADLTTREVDWLVHTEWAGTAEDILWRRSKLGLRFAPAEVTTLERYLAQTVSS